MKLFLFFIFLMFSPLHPVLGQSKCNKFKEFNAKGISANSDKAIEFVSKRNKLTPVNAEIFSIYVIGLHCPEII